MARPDAHTDPADALAFRAARDACRRHAKDLYFASAFLPRPKRDAFHAAYAFCRMIHDAIDAGGDDPEPVVGAAGLRHRPLSAVREPAVATAGLTSGASGACCSSGSLDGRVSLFRDRLNDLYDGRLELPTPAGRSQEHHVLHAFTLTARRYQIPRQYFLDLAEGCRADLSVSRYATWASLERYCRKSGGAAGVIASCIFGVTNSSGSDGAMRAGQAMRLTAVLRNLKADVASGRVYLPLEDLAAFRYSERELSAGVVNDNFRRLMRFQVERVRRLYEEAAEGLCWVAGDGSRLSAATALVWHAGALDAIERQGYDVFSRPPSLGAAEKLRRLPLAWRLTRRRPGRPARSFFASAGGEKLAATP